MRKSVLLRLFHLFVLVSVIASFQPMPTMVMARQVHPYFPELTFPWLQRSLARRCPAHTVEFCAMLFPVESQELFAGWAGKRVVWIIL